MISKTFIKDIENHFEAIDMCIKEEFITQSLILIYTGIDSMAWLGRPDDEDIVTGAQFINWTNTYMKPQAVLNCNGIDIYSARCGIVHSFTAESKMTKNKEAIEIFYTWGTADSEALQNIIDSTDKKAKAVDVSDLFKCFKMGTEKFLNEAKQNKSRKELIKQRSKRRFRSYSLKNDMV